MLNDFNGSSYYRANPYYQQGYLPDGAYKNRKPQYLGQLPQGQEFFQPTNKKHFQRVGYYSTIAEQKIMNSGVRQDNLSPIKDREYFRSLNVADIEGASTNTLISKGVKNKIKAKEQLAKRHYEEQQAVRLQRMKQLQHMEDERKRMQALSKMSKNPQPNYHQVARKSRVEDKSARTEGPTLTNRYEEKKSLQVEGNLKRQQTQPGRIVQKDLLNQNQPNSYRQQLEQTQREIEQLQQQLSQVRAQKQRAQKEHLASNNITPVTYQAKYDLNIYRPNEGSEPNPQQKYYSNRKHQQQLDRLQEHMIANRSLQNELNEYRRSEQLNVKQQREVANEGRVTREQHRRFNPTFLSYGSPSIGLAGKNIVKH